MRLIFSLAVASWFICLSSPAMPDCDGSLKAKAQCKIPVLNLHPTQFCAGFREVGQKVAELRKILEKHGEEALKDHLKEKLVPVVIGPNGVFYLTDHHHLALAAQRSGAVAHLYAKVDANWSRLDAATFWAEMEKAHWVYPYDEHGELVGRLDEHGKKVPAYDRLPQDARGLVDDPYRSLAGAVRDAKDIDKSDKPFAEFLWANFFRAIPIHLGNGEAGFQHALEEGKRWAHSPQASHLPGYQKK